MNVIPFQIRCMTPLYEGAVEYRPKTQYEVFEALDKFQMAQEMNQFNRSMDYKPIVKIVEGRSLWDEFVEWLESIF